MPLADYSRSKREAMLLDAIDKVLRSITKPIETKEMTARVAVLVGETDQSALAKQLSRLMNVTPEVYQTGETFKLYGRLCYRREWRPRTKAPGPLDLRVKVQDAARTDAAMNISEFAERPLDPRPVAGKSVADKLNAAPQVGYTFRTFKAGAPIVTDQGVALPATFIEKTDATAVHYDGAAVRSFPDDQPVAIGENAAEVLFAKFDELYARQNATGESSVLD